MWVMMVDNFLTSDFLGIEGLSYKVTALIPLTGVVLYGGGWNFHV